MGRMQYGSHLGSRGNQTRFWCVADLLALMLAQGLTSSCCTGFLLGLLQNPICAMIALGSEDSVRDHRREVHDRNIREMEEAPPALNTEMERVVRPKSAHFREG